MIAIRVMDMPENCCKCKLKYYDGNGHLHCVFNGADVSCKIDGRLKTVLQRQSLLAKIASTRVVWKMCLKYYTAMVSEFPKISTVQMEKGESK